MYQRTARAAVSTGPEDEPNKPTADREAGDPRERTIWAKIAFQAQRGRCVAVPCRGDKLCVAIAGSPNYQVVAGEPGSDGRGCRVLGSDRFLML